MNRMRSLKILLYSLFGLGCLVLFAVVLFPQDRVKDLVVNRVQHSAPGWTLEIEQSGVAFPLGLKLTDARLSRLNRPFFNADAVIIRPHWLTLLSSDRRFDLEIHAHGGSLSGVVQVRSPAIRSDHLALTAMFADMNLAAIPALRNDPTVEIAGKLSGQMEWAPVENGVPVLTAEVVVVDCIAVISSKRLNQGRFEFDRIEADARIQNRRLDLERCVFSGNQLNGTLSGKGTLKTPLEKTELSLRGTLQVDRATTDQASIRLRSQPASSPKEGLNFRIQGPADNLRFYL